MSQRAACIDMRAFTDEAAHNAGIGISPRILADKLEIGNRCDCNNRLEQFGIEHLGLQRGIPSVRPACDGEPFRIGNALADKPTTSIVYIAGGDIPGLEAIPAIPRFTITRRSAVIRL